MDHIGIIYIYDDDKSDEVEHLQDRNYACGTGVLIGKRIVSTAVHILAPFISGPFPLGKIKFQLTKDSTYEWANVVEVRLTK